jgi:stage V sporulation protein B
MTVFAEPMMRATYGGTYVAATTALQVLIWAYVLEFFNPFFSRVLYALGRERLVLSAAVLGTVLNVVFNILLIPSYNILGAAIATLISASVIFVILLLAVCTILPNTALMKLTVRPVLAGLCMWVFCILLREMRPVGLALSGICVYGVCLLLSRAFSSEELLSFRRALKAAIG